MPALRRYVHKFTGTSFLGL